MKQKHLLSIVLMLIVAVTASAQRVIDKLDRGLIAIKTTSGVYVNWRIQSDEYFDVTYNLYRDGTKIAENLKVSNYSDANGSTSSKYTVAAVKRGVEQSQCTAITAWSNDYLEIVPKHDSSLTSTYVPNDACCADVDGDGQVEILMKYDNQSEVSNSYPEEGYNGEYSLFECLKLDGTVLWWVNCGPNMGDFQNNEQNIVAYDWDQDGKAEAVFRAADGTVIHMADGTTYTVGDASLNYRSATGGGTNWFMHSGAEYLLYVNGATGKPYVCQEYPLKRLEDSENPSGLLSGTDYDNLVNKAWGDGYGHRSTKHFFGAPYLDGRKPSIFLGRGIYTRHKFIAYDVDPSTHTLTQRWRWDNNTDGPWKGQGYHNYGIADVDMDGRDEIIWGSMVIDDNGMGLSSVDLGHGDSQHHGDFDPYTWGLEGFFCNEDNPGNNLRDLTTAKIYYRNVSSNDDGRCIIGNFSDAYPGCQASSARDYDNAISSVTHDHLSIGTSGMAQNFRIYWDGDLCDETFNYSNGKNTEGAINKYSKGIIKTLTGSMTNNDTKGTPCFQGDILGDWREEVIMRTASNNIRIYSSTYPTEYRNYSLWYDHQYRNAMVWQMCGYNQSPHVSYFLGELEGITAAPPAETMEGRTEIANNGTISTTDGTVITCETNDMTVNVAANATPYIYIDNAPSWVQGWAVSNSSAANDPSKIVYQYYTHTLTGSAFTGETRVVKQGEGTLVLPNVTQTYTGNTDVWNGTLSFDGTMQSSRVWLNRHTSLTSDGGSFKTIEANYNATIYPGGKDAKQSTITADSLILGFGSKIVFDIYSDNAAADNVNANVLKIEKKVWTNGGGPTYDVPVFYINAHPADGESVIADGKYLLGTVGKIDGDIANVIVDNMTYQKTELSYEDGKLYLTVVNPDSQPVTWVGDKSSTWDIAKTVNFKTTQGDTETEFNNGAAVLFNDDAKSTTVTVSGNPAVESLTIEGANSFVFDGDSIVGDGEVIMNGTGFVKINNVNHVGNTTIGGGYLYVSSLANSIGNDYGSLGSVDKTIKITNSGVLAASSSLTNGQKLIISGEGKISAPSGIEFTQTGAIATSGVSTLYKIGAGTFNMPTTFAPSKLIISAGTVYGADGVSASLPKTVEFRGGSYVDSNSEGSYSKNASNFVVEEGQTGSLTLDPRCEYSGSLTGAGTFTVIAGGVRNTLGGNWSAFEGELVVQGKKRGSYDPDFTWNNSYGLPSATLNVQSGYTFNTNGKSITLKNIKDKATGTISGGGTITVGAGYEADMTVQNTISTPIIYVGEPGYQYYVSNDYMALQTAAFTVKSGTLYLYGNRTVKSQKTFNGSYVTTVTDDGILAGYSYSIGNVAVTNGGKWTITYGSDAVTTAYPSAIVNIRSNGVLDMKIKSSSSYSKIIASSSFTFWSGSKLNIRIDDSYTPKVGDSFTLWTVSGSFSGDDTKCTVTLPELPAGFKWDTSELFNATGVLKVVADPTAVYSTMADDKPLTADVYNVDGTVLGRISTTKAALNNAVRKLAGQSGTYVVKFVSGTITDNVTIRVK